MTDVFTSGSSGHLVPIGSLIRLTSRGTLQVAGTGENDVIRITRRGSRIVASVRLGTNFGDGSGSTTIATSFAPADVKRISVNGFGGKDDIQLGGTVTERATLSGGGGNDTIVGGAGPETISGGDGNDVIKAGPVDGVSNVAVTAPRGAWNAGRAANFDTVTSGVVASAAPSLIYGGAGDDTIGGSAAVDTISGGAGHDVYRTAGNRIEPGRTFGEDQVAGIEVVELDGGAGSSGVSAYVVAPA